MLFYRLIGKMLFNKNSDLLQDYKFLDKRIAAKLPRDQLSSCNQRNKSRNESFIFCTCLASQLVELFMKFPMLFAGSAWLGGYFYLINNIAIERHIL